MSNEQVTDTWTERNTIPDFPAPEDYPASDVVEPPSKTDGVWAKGPGGKDVPLECRGRKSVC